MYLSIEICLQHTLYIESKKVPLTLFNSVLAFAMKKERKNRQEENKNYIQFVHCIQNAMVPGVTIENFAINL